MKYKVIVPFVDSTDGKSYLLNDDFKASKKRVDELLALGLISKCSSEPEVTEPDKDLKNDSDVKDEEPETENNEETEETEDKENSDEPEVTE